MPVREVANALLLTYLGTEYLLASGGGGGGSGGGGGEIVPGSRCKEVLPSGERS